jgi:restriction system protein
MSKDNYNRYRASLELREILDAMTPTEFEAFIGELFRQMGYGVSITSASGDEGVDLFLEKEGRKAIVQCKRQKGSVGQPVVRDLVGTMVHNRADQGFIVTTGTFSLPAQTWAEGKPIQLVDGAGLLDWIK